MEKERILAAIRQCAEDNGGVAVGRGRFEKLTGIREAQWAGRYWLRWSDAVVEAGYSPAAMNAALPDDIVLDALVLFIRELGHYPVTTEFRMRRRADPSFPDHKVYRRFGTKPELAARVIEHVGKDPERTVSLPAVGRSPRSPCLQETPSKKADSWPARST